jgi:hypothetical protein
MFIDRMRSAAQTEGIPQQTVAQQVFAPPAPQPPMGAPAGLGATPEAAAMPPQEMGPPPQGMGAPQEMPPQEMPPQEMAPPEMAAPEEMPMGMKGGGKVHGHFSASDKGSEYGAGISLDDLNSFSLEGSGRRVFDPDSIIAALRHRKGDTELSAEHTLRGGTDYGYERPFLGGRLGIHAGASRGFIPDSIRASYNRSFADGGMVPPYASGGLSGLPVPDTMFDEPNNGGYAGGGMVAFAAGASVPRETDGQRYERLVLEAIPGTIVTSRQRSAAKNAQVGGVPNSFHKTDQARDFVPPKGMSLTEFGAKIKDILGPEGTDVIYNSKGHKDHAHVEPGRRGKELVEAAKEDNTVYGLPTNLLGSIELAKSMIPEQSAEDLEYRKELAESLSPERRKQDKKDAFFEGLGKFGARLGASKNPSFLGGLAETLGAGAGDIAESLDADKKRIREMQRERAQLANATRKEEMDAVAMGFDLTGKVAQLDQGIQARKEDLAIKREDLQMRQEEFNTRRVEAQKALEAAGLKFDLDKYLVTEINAGGDRAKNANAFMAARYGDKGAGAKPFQQKLDVVAPGTVQDGYKFKGGDPSVESNWEKVK